MRYATPNRNRPIRLEGQPHRRRVNAQATTPNLSDPQWLEAMACFKPLWDLAQQLDSLLAAQASSQHGRAPKRSTFGGLFFEVATRRLGSYSSAERTLADPVMWDRLCSAVEAAWPDHPKRRLPDRPMTRAQNYKFRERCSSDVIEAMRHMVEDAAVAATQSIGVLVPGLGSPAHPDMRAFVSADDCWIGRMTEPGSPSDRLMMVVARNPHPMEQAVLSVRANLARNGELPTIDGTMAADTVLDLLERFPNLRTGLRGVVNDVWSTKDIDRLLGAGLIAVSRARRTDPRFDEVVGMRESTEAMGCYLRANLWNAHRSMSARQVEIKAIALQVHVLIAALVAHHNRTRTLDTTEWFGLHQLPPSGGPARCRPRQEVSP